MAGQVSIYGGAGHGKSPAAMGRALQVAAAGGNVVIIQFLKGKGEEYELFRRLEPEIKIFRFEKSEEDFDSLDEERRKEEIRNIKNGIGFARKVINTGGCDLLILDEMLGLVDNEIMSVEELKELLDARPEQMDVILTGITLFDEVCMVADEIIRIESMNYKVF